MNEKSLRVLEWPKVRELVAQRASFSLSKEKISEMLPHTDMGQVVHELALTTEGVRLLWKHGDAPFGGASDIRAVVGRAKLGGTLDPEQLLSVGDFLYCVGQLRKYLADEEGPLAEYLQRLAMVTGLREDIERCIDHDGTVRDWASPELGRIRSKMRTLANRIRDRLKLSTSHYAEGSAIITVRNGRYVVPVKSEYRRGFQVLSMISRGACHLVHGTSCR